jgi:hypothetical protein
MFDILLYFYVEINFTLLVKLLLKTEKCTSKGINEALYWAALNGRTDAMKFLLGTGLCTSEGINEALYCAAEQGHTDAMKLFLNSKKCTPGGVDNALKKAVSKGYTDAVHCLLSFKLYEKDLLEEVNKKVEQKTPNILKQEEGPTESVFYLEHNYLSVDPNFLTSVHSEVSFLFERLGMSHKTLTQIIARYLDNYEDYLILLMLSHAAQRDGRIIKFENCIEPYYDCEGNEGITNPYYWYSDEDMNSLLPARIAQADLQENVHVVNAIGVSAERIGEGYTQMLVNGIAENGGPITVVPVNMNGNHWIGAIIERYGDAYTVTFIDSLGADNASNSELRDLFEAAIRLYSDHNRIEADLRIVFVNSMDLNQDDESSCGPLTIENIIRHITRESGVPLTPDEIRAMHQQILNLPVNQNQENQSPGESSYDTSNMIFLNIGGYVPPTTNTTSDQNQCDEKNPFTGESSDYYPSYYYDHSIFGSVASVEKYDNY